MFCWFFRLMISHTVDADTQPSPITEKHIRHCTSCREFHQTCQSLAEGLRQEAAISNDNVWFSGRILTVVTCRRSHTYKVGMKLWTAAAVACVALIVLIGALLLVTQRKGRDNAQSSQTQMVDAIQELRTLYRQVGKDLPIIRPGTIEKPLANEFKSLTNDTQSAVRFLVACVAVDIPGTAANQ